MGVILHLFLLYVCVKFAGEHLYYAMHITGVFVPDMKLHHSRTIRQNSSQNHQVLHRRAAVIETEKRYVHINDLVLADLQPLTSKM